MDILRTGISLLSHIDPDCEDNSPEAERERSACSQAHHIGPVVARDGGLFSPTPNSPTPETSSGS